MKNKKAIAVLLLVAMLFSIIPTAVFAEETNNIPFTATADGIVLTVESSNEIYTYVDWNNTTYSSILYVVSVPSDTESIVLNFDTTNVLAYGYDSSHNYIASYGEGADYWKIGDVTATISKAAFAEYVRVQTPYYDGTNSDLLYAIHIVKETSTPEIPVWKISIDELLENISAIYIDDISEWVIMDMAAYEDLNSETTHKISQSAKQEYINSAINKIAKEETLSESDYAKLIITLAALGIDPTELYLKNSNTSVNAIEELKTLIHGSSAWVAPYTLAAYQQGSYESEAQERTLLDAVLANQSDDGCWNEWGDSIQTTSNMIAGLAFYYKEYADVKTAVDKAIEYLSSVQKSDGSYDAYGTGADSNTAAMVVIALASVGINPETDERFIKNEASALDNLLSFVLADNIGFGYTDNSSINSYSTEQGFRALIAASQVMKTGKAFNVYDFSGNTLVPGYEKEITPSGGSGSYVPKDDKIAVKVSIKAIDDYWMQNKSVTLEEDATVSDALLKAIKGTGITQVGAENGYIESMEYNGMELGEFTHGDFSGWMYKVNGTAPNVGVTDYSLRDGDKILFYFTKDYTNESMEEDEEKDEDKKDEESKPTTTPVTEVLNDVNGHWAIDAIQFVYDRGLLTGISENEFAPDLAVTRAMMTTIMYGMAGNPEHGWHYPFHDVFDMAWYVGPVAWAYENKLVYGVSDTSYAPETSITREQVAMMLMRYANFKGYDISQTVSLNHYKDAKNVSDYAESAMQWAVAIGMIGGRTADTLCAQDTATRAELSVMLRNFITLYEPVDSNNGTTK